MNQFYVYLFSNSSAIYFNKNTLSSFKTQLASRITLGDEWVCGLSEILYNPSSSETRQAFESSIVTDPVKYNSLKLKSTDGEYEIIKFPQQNFQNLEHMFTYLFGLVNNHHLGQQMVDQIIKLIQYKSTVADQMTFKAPYKKSVLTNSLMFKTHKIRFAVQHYPSVSDFFDEIEQFAIDKNVRMELLSTALLILLNNVNYFHKLTLHSHETVVAHIYCNIIASVRSGDSLSKSIRVTQLNRKGGQIQFNPIYYHTLSHFNFDVIDISIRNDDGEFINFKASEKPTLIILHFQRV